MKKYKYSIILLVLLLVISLVSIFVGAYDIDFNDILNGDYLSIIILLKSRLPRLLAILCTGFGLSIAGLIMQNVCRNKFVSPSTAATITSSQLGILIALLIFPSASLITKTSLAFITSIIGTLVFVYFIQRIKFKDVIMVPLIGLMFNSVVGAIVSFIAYEFDLTQILSGILVGDFSSILAGRYEIVYLIVPLVIIAYFYANHFNIIGMGENFSKNLGVNYRFILIGSLIIASLITASTVVVVGTISYIGLIVPNIVSMFKGDRIKANMLDTGLFGSLFLLVCDVFGRVIISPFELPIELTAGVIGSLIFIVLLYKRLSVKKIKRVGKSL